VGLAGQSWSWVVSTRPGRTREPDRDMEKRLENARWRPESFSGRCVGVFIPSNPRHTRCVTGAVIPLREMVSSVLDTFL
jgi:hypothetical protein